MRRTYLLVLVALFFLIIPAAFLYASGYRLADGFSLVETGGIYLSVPEIGASVSINGAEEGVTSIFSRRFYIDDLAPGSYVVQVTREGDMPWYRTLVVEPGIVTDAHALSMPLDITSVELVRGGTTETEAARSISATTFDAYKEAFLPEPPVLESTATTTEALPEDTSGGLALSLALGNVVLAWTRDSSSTPSILCARPSSCVSEVFIEKGKDEATRAEFYGGGVVYQTKERGVFFAEMDVRPTPLSVPLYAHRAAEFRIVDGAIIVKDGTRFYEVLGL